MAEEQEVRSVLDRSASLVAEELYEENERILREAIQRYPDDPGLMLQLGVALLGTPSQQQAAEYIRRAIELKSGPWELTRAANAMLHLKEFDTARQYVKQARDLIPEGHPLWPDLAFLAGQLALEKGNDAGGEQLLALAFEADPGARGHGRVLAEFHLEKGRLVQALEVVSTALKHRRDDEGLQELRATIMGRLDMQS